MMQTGQRDFVHREFKWPGRLSAMLLLLSLLLPFAQSALAPQGGENALIPVCCRTHGKHQCLLHKKMSDQSASSSSTHISQLSEKCPYTPGVMQLFHHDLLWHGAVERSHMCWGSDRSRPRQIARLALLVKETNHKRGPPFFSNFA